MAHQIQGSQSDFSAGEVDPELKRNDQHPARKTGARQMSNWRILNSKGVSNRPGRSALYFETGRIERVLMSPGNYFDIVFGNGYLRVYNASGTQIFTSNVKGDGSTAIPWTLATVNAISFGVIGLSVYIAYTAGYPNNPPQVLSWNGTSLVGGWTLATYAEVVTAGGQKRTPFYRISPTNITLQPSATSGTVNIAFSAPVLIGGGMIGTRLSYCGRQITIASITDTQHGTATVNEQLLGSETLPFASSPAGIFNIGDEVKGSISGAVGIVLSVGGGSIAVQIIPPATTFVSGDVVAGPGGSLTMNAGASAGSPGAVSLWNDEVMNAYRGYPQSVFVDQGRLGLTNVPSVPAGIIWSSIGVYNDIWVDPLVSTGSPASAIFEIAPGKLQVYYVVPGMESSEFVFCDNAIYSIPISVQNPLVPGSVQFVGISSFGSVPNVQPKLAEQCIIYMKAGGLQVGAIQAPGAYNRPFIIDSISDLHSHLFVGRTPLAIAIPSQSLQFEELYIYVAFTDGTLVVGKYAMRNGLIETAGDGKPSVGWVPWISAGNLLWVSAFNATVLFMSTYNIVGAQPQSLVEQIDATQYLDGAVFVNNLPAAIVAQQPGGKGPLWFIAGGTVALMDQSTRSMGIYKIDADGNIIPQNNGGENLAVASLVAGQPWTATLEPFAQDTPSGNDMHQRMLPRRISYFAAYVVKSTGFVLAKLFSAKQTPTSPALGTVVNIRRVPAWNIGDDATKPPPLRETVEEWRPSGYSYDPRVAVIKDTPGPLLIEEIGVEISI